MADHLASIFGTEKDRVNCPFYFKIGACRHGDRCSRLHNRPTISPTILLHNLYMNPVLNAPLGPDGLPMPVDPDKVQDFFEDFYEDIFLELDKFGEVEHLCVCDNLADHMVGNVYVKFRDEEAAARALQGFQGRYYAGKPIQVEFSPVTDFRESTCRQYEEGTCNRGGYCNFMHVRPVSKDLRRQLFGRYKGGSGGSTKFHDSDSRPRGGSRYGNGGSGRYNDRGRRGSGRYEERDRDRGRDRGRSRYDEPQARSRDRDASAERRARIAKWNSEAGAAQGGTGPAAQGPPPQYGSAYGGGYGAAYQAPPQQPEYAPAPPAMGPPGYGAHPPPPQHQQHHYGGSKGGSGANTIPISNMRSFPPQSY